MTREEFESMIPFRIMHPSHGELERKIEKNKDGIISVSYVRYNSKLNMFDNTSSHNTYGTNGKSFKEVFDSLYPFLVEQGHIIDNEIDE